ncbi:MAG: hypothetical protein QW076_04100 [Candidatus Anstonellales archaeon]
MSIERYSTEISKLFSEEYKYKTWAEVEIALLKAYVNLGIFDKKEGIDKRALERSRLFTWEKTAEETLKLYEAVFGRD